MDANPIKVLLVHDDDLLAELVRITLKSAGGFEWLGQARTAEAAAQLASHHAPDVVLIDICLAGEDCFVVLEQLQRAHREARMMIFSECLSDHLIARALLAGASGCISPHRFGPTMVNAIRAAAWRDPNRVSASQCRA